MSQGNPPESFLCLNYSNRIAQQIYAESIQAKLKHYRDSAGREIDAIVELRNGDYAAVEVKICSEKI